MPLLKSVLGLDLGSHSVKAVELRQTFSGVEPVQLRLAPRVHDESLMAQAMNAFVELHQLPLEYVVCAIPGDRLSTRRLEFPFRDRKKLAQAIPFEVEGAIPFELEQVLVDWEVTGTDRSRAKVVTAIAQRSEVRAQLAGLEAWGCEPRVLEAEGLALANLSALFDLPGTQLLVDIGHRKTTLCALADGRPLAARSVPVAGLALSQAIAQDRGFALTEAERCKCEEGIFETGFESSCPRAVALIDRLAREIVRTLESLAPLLGGSPEQAVQGISLCGGTAKLHRLDRYLSERTGVPTCRLALPSGSEGAALVAGGDPLLFAPAIALALRGTSEAVTQIDFRKEEFAYRTDLRQFFGPEMRWTGALAGAALGLLVLGAGISISLESGRADRLEAQAMQLYTEAFPGLPPPTSPVAAMRNALDAARDRADLLGVYGGRRSALGLLAELSRRVPQDLKVQFEDVHIDGRVVRIKVFAVGFEAADRLESELARETPFESARTGEISTDRKRGGQTFTLTISLDAGEESA